MKLTREQILTKRAAVTETVPAPELGEGATITVRRLTAGEFMTLSEQTKASPGLAYANWIVATAIDDEGRKLFTDDDAAALAELDITLIERLTDAAQRLNIAKKATGPNQQTPPADSSTASR